MPHSAAPAAPATGAQPIPVDRQMNHPNGTDDPEGRQRNRRVEVVLRRA